MPPAFLLNTQTSGAWTAREALDGSCARVSCTPSLLASRLHLNNIVTRVWCMPSLLVPPQQPRREQDMPSLLLPPHTAAFVSRASATRVCLSRAATVMRRVMKPRDTTRALYMTDRKPCRLVVRHWRTGRFDHRLRSRSTKRTSDFTPAPVSQVVYIRAAGVEASCA